MAFEPDTLVAIAFIAPVLYYAVINVVIFRACGYKLPAKPQAPEAASDGSFAVNAVAANDGEMRRAA